MQSPAVIGSVTETETYATTTYLHKAVLVEGEDRNKERDKELLYYRCYYSRFKITFHCNMPNFVAKFENSLRSSKFHFRIHKPVRNS